MYFNVKAVLVMAYELQVDSFLQSWPTSHFFVFYIYHTFGQYYFLGY